MFTVCVVLNFHFVFKNLTINCNASFVLLLILSRIDKEEYAMEVRRTRFSYVHCNPCKTKLLKFTRSITDDNDDVMERGQTDVDGSQLANKTLPNLKDLQAELLRITERHEALKSEAASKCKLTTVGGHSQTVNVLDPVKKNKAEVVEAIPVKQLEVTAADLAALGKKFSEEPDDRYYEFFTGKFAQLCYKNKSL